MKPSIIIADPAKILGELLGLWAECFGDDFPLDERLLSQQLALDTDPRKLFITRADDDSLSGALLAKRVARAPLGGEAPSIGNVSFIMVAQNHRRKGLGSRLFAEAAAWLGSSGAAEIRLGRDTYHLFPGMPTTGTQDYFAIAAFAAKQGFLPEREEFDLIADLSALDLDALAVGTRKPVGYSFVPYSRELDASMRLFFERNFPGRWYGEVLEALEAGMRSEDFFLAVDSEGAVRGFSRIYTEESTVLGPGLYWRKAMGKNPGGLGPIGIDQSLRGNGLGLALLHFCLGELKSRGVGTMVIDWTDLVGFYAKMGFAVWKAYRLMSRTQDRT